MNLLKIIFKRLSLLFTDSPGGAVSEAIPPVQKPVVDESRIVKDYSVTDKWHKGFNRNINDISEIVIHHSDGTGDIYTLRDWMLGGERKADYEKGISLFHFCIDREGRIWMSGPLDRWWYHSCSGKHDKYTIGIELIQKSGPFSDEQYKSLSWLIFEDLAIQCPNLSRIVSHDFNYLKYSGRSKGCPGPDFDWHRLEHEMQMRGLEFNSGDKEEYTVRF